MNMQFWQSGNNNNNSNNIHIIFKCTRLCFWAFLPVIALVLLDCVLSSSPSTSNNNSFGEGNISNIFELIFLKRFLVTLQDKIMTASLPNRLGDEDDDDIEKIIARLSRRFSFMGGSDRNININNKHEHEHDEHSCATNSKMPASYNGRNSLFLFSKSQAISTRYLLTKSTQENFGVENKEFFGPFKEVRAGLDFDYHGNYSKCRQEFQDRIVEKLLDGTTIHDTTNGRVCKTPTEPWIVFTAGVMGAGKSHTMKQLASKGLFPLKSYIIVDPDEIRSHFPEYHLYATQSPQKAGELTHREAGYVTEIVTAVAMQRGYNVLVDGSLKDFEWYEQYFKCLRNQYAKIRIAILHIVAPRASIFERAASRAKSTGRVVPIETLEMSLKQVPISVKKLAPTADFFCELDNSPNSGKVSITTEGITEDSFRDNWAQSCPWVPPGKM